MANVLPDEILQRIFEYFSIHERLKFESICKRWQRLMPYRIDRIDLVDILIPAKRLKMADTFPLTPALNALLSRCGPYLRRISFGKSNLLIPFTIVNKIDEYCPVLECLDLSFCTVTEQIIPALMNLSDRLISLDFGNTTFSIRYPSQHVDNMSILFANLNRLECVNLQRTNANNLLAVGHLSETLRILNLNACSPLSPDTLFEVIIKCYDLEELRISAYSRMNYSIVQAICTLPKLRILDISRQTGEFFDDGRQDGVDWKQLKHVKTLQELYAQYNDHITDTILESISNHCKDLRILNVSYCRGISQFSTWLGRLDRLRSFYVASNDAITDFDIRALCDQNNRSLRVFHSSSCPLISGESVHALARCQNLIDLNMGQCESIANPEIETLLNKCPNLETLDLRCTKITDALFENISDFTRDPNVMRRLKSMDLSFCQGISEKGVKNLCEFLAKSGPRAEPITIFVHRTRVPKSIVAAIDSNVAKIQF